MSRKETKETETTEETDYYSSNEKNTVADLEVKTDEITKGLEDGSCETEKDNKSKCKPFYFVDHPNKPEIPSPYINKSMQLEKTNRDFTLKEFQVVRSATNRQNVLEAYKRIGTVLNEVDPTTLPKQNIDKVCFILVNSCNNDYDYYGYGPFNDAYMVAKFHKDMGFNVALIYNPKSPVFLQFLEYFLTYTSKNLTFYYTGRDSITKKSIDHGIRFNDDTCIFQDDLASFVFEKCNEQTKIIILSDCYSTGSIINMGKIKDLTDESNRNQIKIVAFNINKKKVNPRETNIKLTHGLFTYYFCTFTKHYPRYTPKEVISLLNISFLRFKISFTLMATQDELIDKVFFDDAADTFDPRPVEKDDEVSEPKN